MSLSIQPDKTSTQISSQFVEMSSRLNTGTERLLQQSKCALKQCNSVAIETKIAKILKCSNSLCSVGTGQMESI
jgi:hypothetical protein